MRLVGLMLSLRLVLSGVFLLARLFGNLSDESEFSPGAALVGHQVLVPDLLAVLKGVPVFPGFPQVSGSLARVPRGGAHLLVLQVLLVQNICELCLFHDFF